ncbi:MAG: (2Fe-2S)-binding protein, partial [Tidjanibacter sp.]|nr:(2Fe-2S)-binding protein [Tidjanibacter sp.]
GIVCLDHAERDGLEGFVTITGGKLMTYRLMAEWATDMVCRKLGTKSLCTTATTPLPSPKVESAKGANESLFVSLRKEEAMVCECERISVAEVTHAVRSLGASSVVDLRRRTRLGMGTCQSHLCSLRAAGVLAQNGVPQQKALEGVGQFLDERWRGARPIAWGGAMADAQFTRWFYDGVCGLGERLEKK